MDGLRGFAAIAVMVAHIDIMSKLRSGVPPFFQGHMAVDVFFVLSGFVMSHSYLGKPLDWAEFAKARFARIYPLHIASALGLLCLAWTGQLIFSIEVPQHFRDPQEAVEEILLLSALPGFEGQVWNSPSWSISIEWWIYFSLFPVIALLNRRSSILPIAIGLFCMYGAFGILIDMTSGEKFTRGWFAVGRGILGFSLGWSIWRIWRDTPWMLSGAFIDLCGLAILLAWFAVPQFSTSDGWFALPLIAIVIFGFSREVGLFSRVLSLRPFVWLGDISYSIYLTHMLVLLPLKYALSAFNLDDNFIAWLMFGTGGTLFLSTISYYYLEKPARKSIRSYQWRKMKLA
ncbi:acyltransferase family protein [Croceicoccus marinus]|uniref:Acyltransferase n=1 Tax=Croceicoccus marinus TaxID=450378 RepID=A0A1Z1FHA0_9SPHN|nr:acyltransferase [Croceicoccus marinus]ARU18103.1 acyltransferase [Croceicoccus marinus]QNE06859.1 acyltransferase [Croceicoccus marinus]